MAQLPSSLLEPVLRDMAVGTSAWTVPWAMMVDGNRACFLNGRYTISRKSGGTVQMRVDRTDEPW